jgi:hypothetical protein
MGLDLMKTELFTIFVAVISGTLALLGVGISALMSNRRERIAFTRTVGRERVESLQIAFEQALVVLERHARNFGRSSDADTAEMLQMKARLSLRATSIVRDKFERTADVLDKWASEARQGSPKPGQGGAVIFTSGFGEEKHNKREEELWLSFCEEREFLVGAMRACLNEAEGNFV